MKKDQTLTGNVAIVSGASRGIGAAVSRRIAAMGAHVVLLGRDEAALAEVQAAIDQSGGAATAMPVDLRDEIAVQALAETVTARWGRCDVLVNNAAVGRLGKPLHEMSAAEWDETMQTNLRAPFLLMRAFTPLMIAHQSGHIVNISSLAGSNPLPNGAAYSASKWGLNGLTYSVAEELREQGIRVAVIAPGSVNTGFGGSGNKDAAKSARKLQPDDIADAVELLLRQEPQSFISEIRMRPTRKG
jgi:NAD(P)-dependent dehydrogenase (short-subunit alcohol dehydrogenase family)